MIAMHGIANGVARNENVSIDRGDRLVRDNKTIAVMVQHQSTRRLVLARSCRLGARGRWLRRPFAGRFPTISGGLTRAAPREPVASAGQLLNGLSLFEFRQHLEKGPVIGLFQLQALDNIHRGG
jgi:hypothetical protein